MPWGEARDGAPGCLRPYLLRRSPPRRAQVVAGSSSAGLRLLLCLQVLQQLPRDEAEQRGQLAVGPQVLGLEGAAAERAEGAGPPRAVAQDAAPAEAVAAAREPHGLREELQAAGALQLQDALQPLQLDDSSHGSARAGGSGPAVSISRAPPPVPRTPRAAPALPRSVLLRPVLLCPALLRPVLLCLVLLCPLLFSVLLTLPVGMDCDAELSRAWP